MVLDGYFHKQVNIVLLFILEVVQEDFVNLNEVSLSESKVAEIVGII